MTTSAKATPTARKAAATKTATTVHKTATPATPPASEPNITTTNDRLDLGALAAGAKTVAEPPKPARGGGKPGGAFADVVLASLGGDGWTALPPVADDRAVTTLRNALRRAAMAHNLGLSVRPVKTDDGKFIVNFKATRRNG